MYNEKICTYRKRVCHKVSIIVIIIIKYEYVLTLNLDSVNDVSNIWGNFPLSRKASDFRSSIPCLCSLLCSFMVRFKFQFLMAVMSFGHIVDSSVIIDLNWFSFCSFLIISCDGFLVPCLDTNHTCIGLQSYRANVCIRQKSKIDYTFIIYIYYDWVFKIKIEII